MKDESFRLLGPQGRQDAETRLGLAKFNWVEAAVKGTARRALKEYVEVLPL